MNAGGGPAPTPSRLPDEFRELAYIECSGTQWIDTGVVPTNTTGFYVDVQKTTNNHTDSIVIGVRQSTGNTRCHVDIDHSSVNGNFLFGWNTNTAGGNRITVGLDRVTAELNYKNSRKCIINGTERSGYSAQLNSTLSSGSYTLYLFSNNLYGTAGAGFVGKVWNIKITSDTSIIHDYVPAMRKADSVVGVYDLVSDTFKTNGGTGTFGYGEL